MEQLKKILMDGQTVVFDNEKFCAETQSDDFAMALCEFISKGKVSLLDGFQIRFNGAIFLYKTFKAFEKKLTQLKQDFSLEFNEVETELQNQ